MISLPPLRYLTILYMCVCVFICVCVIYMCVSTYVFSNPFVWASGETRSIFKWNLQVWIQSFPSLSCLTKSKEPILPYYLPIAGGRIIGFIPFSKVLVLWEIQSALSRFELLLLCPFPMMITITPLAHMCVCVCVCMYIHVLICIYVHVCMHMHEHTHTHTHTRISAMQPSLIAEIWEILFWL